MPFITFTVTGIDDITNNLNKFTTQSRNLRQTVLNQTADFMVSEMRNNVHVITGNLKSSIRSQPVSDNQILVEAGADYAVYENARVGGVQGPHDFATRAEQATRNMFPNIVSSIYGNFFSSL